MTFKWISAVVTLFVLAALIPHVSASFTSSPTFDLVASSNLGGATDAAYSLNLENLDQAEDVVSVSITIPAGYAIGQEFITTNAGVKVGSLAGQCPSLSGQGDIATTTTSHHYSISAFGFMIGEIVISEPDVTNPGKMDLSFTGGYSLVNHGCSGQIELVKGFFVNPSGSGTYVWAPSVANPVSGPPVTMDARLGFSQTVTIVGTATTTSTTSIPEFSAPFMLILVIALTLPIAVIGKKNKSTH